MQSTKQCIRVRLDIRRGDLSDLVIFSEDLDGDLMMMMMMMMMVMVMVVVVVGGGGDGGDGGRAHLPRRFKRQLNAKFLKWQLL